MDAIQVVAIILSSACAALGLAACVLVIRLIPVVKQLEEISQSAKQVIERVDGVVANLETVSRGAVKVERRVSGVVSTVMDQVEPEVRRVAAIAAGVRTTLGRLMGSRAAHSSNGRDERIDLEIERRLS